MVINEQIRRYNEKMEEIEQLEYAEALAVNQLKLKRQNTVTHETLPYTERPFVPTVYSAVQPLCLEKNVIIEIMSQDVTQ